MLAVVWPLSWLLLVPIVIVEARMASRIVAVDRKTAMMGSAIANAVSTFAGIPVAWVMLFAAELALQGPGSKIHNPRVAEVLGIVVSSPWLPGEGWATWVIPAAAAILQVPFFFISVYIEAEVFRRATECDPRLARRWGWLGNLVSYGAIVLCLGGFTIWFALRRAG